MSAITDPDVGSGQGAAHTLTLDGRVLSVPGRDGDERPGAGASFRYTQAGDLVHATYTGGTVRLGYRVGTRHGNHLEFRWAEVLTTGETRCGRADARLEVLPDGRVRLHELWSVDAPGSRTEGVGVADEMAWQPDRAQPVSAPPAPDTSRSG
jgi:hypothetical protein